MAEDELVAVDARNGFTYIGIRNQNTSDDLTLRDFLVLHTRSVAGFIKSYRDRCLEVYENSNSASSIQIFDPVAVCTLREEPKKNLDCKFEEGAR